MTLRKKFHRVHRAIARGCWGNF